MKYTFQDSTELPVQRDFIKDLQAFVKLAQDVIPLEKKSIILNEKKNKGTESINGDIRTTEEFETSVLKAIQDISVNVDSLVVSGLKEEMKNSVTSIILNKKKELSKQLEDLLKTADYEIDELNLEIVSLLEPFFKEGVYYSMDAYSLQHVDEEIRAIQVSSVEDMKYSFDLELNSRALKVEDFHKKITLPVWATGGLLHREAKVKNIDVTDYHIMSIEYDGDEHLETTFQDKDSEHIFRLIADENIFNLFHNDEDVTLDEALSPSIGKEDVLLLAKKMKQYFSLAVKSLTLKDVMLGEKDAISYNLVLECLKTIAVKYGALIDECLARGYNKGEITIKLELPDETRSEKYMSKADLFEQLSGIGSEGQELAGLLNVAEE